MTTSEKSDYDLVMTFLTQWTEIVTDVIVVVGLASNAISIFILTREELRSAFTNLLVFLSASDAAFLAALVGFELTVPAALGPHPVERIAGVRMFAYVFYPLAPTALTCSTYMTIAIGVLSALL